MTLSADSPLVRQVTGALDWWREAGVDLTFADEPQPWILAEPEPQTPPAAAAPMTVKPVAEPLPMLGGDPALWPDELAQFQRWWTQEPNLDAGQLAGRIPPTGAAHAPLLVLVEQPEQSDHEILLSGPDGKLARAMLAAMGVAPEHAYFASVLPRAMPHPDWAQLADQGLGAILLHHLTLAAPKRVIAFGGNILPLLGHDPAKSPEILLQLNQEGLQVPVLAARELATLRARPAWKAGLWRRWLDWTG